jgi:hypothetical protein
MNPELLGLLGLIGIGAGGTAATSAAYDRLKEIGNQAVLGANVQDPVTGETLQIPGAAQIAAESLGLSQFRPFTVTTATGGQFGVTPQVDPKTGVVTGLGTTMGLSPAEQQLQQTLMGQAATGIGATPFGQQMGQQAATSAFGLGGQFMGAAGQQPSDLNLLRGMFTQRAAGGLGGGQMGQLGQQLPFGRPASVDSILPPGFVSDNMLYPDMPITQGPVSTFTNPQTGEKITMTNGLGGMPREIVSRRPAPEGYQPQEMPSSGLQGLTAKGMSQAPTISQFGQRALGLGMAGLDAQAPSDVEALRQQYTQLASQTAGRALQDTAGREADVYERIRATQRPEEERQRLALEERMAQQGRLGVRTAMYGGTPEQAALAMQQEEAQNRASLAAIQQAQAERQQAVSEAQTFGGLFGQQAGLSSQLQSAAQQRAAQLSQLGLSSQQIESQLQSEGLGRAVTSASQAAQLAQVAGGLQAQQAGLGAQYASLGSQLAMQNLAAQQAQQQLGLGALTGAYMPQAQLLNAMQAQQLYPQLQQQAQLFGTGQYGETMMSGLEARLIAEQARANLIGGLGSGLLGGLFSPIATQGGGVGSLFTGILDMFGGGDEDNSGGP